MSNQTTTRAHSNFTRSMTMPVLLLLIATVCVGLGWVAGNQHLQPSPVYAQDAYSPPWTVTSVKDNHGNEYVVVVSLNENPLEEGRVAKQMAVYEIRGAEEDKPVLNLVAARTMTYDFRYAYIDPNRTGDYKYRPDAMKKDLGDTEKDK